MVDVLLVNPPSSKPAITGGVARTYMPLGLGYLAAALIGNGFSTKILDSDVAGLNVIEVADHILSTSPRILGLSVMSTTLRECHLLASTLCSKGFPGEIVVGGPHITALPETVSEMGLSYGIVGEGEKSFPKLCRALIQGTDSTKATGIFDASRKRPVKPSFIPDIDSLLQPARHLLPVDRYSHLSFITSRGCPMKCAYCFMPQNPYRIRSPENVVLEVEEAVAEYGLTQVSFVDDNFTFNRERTIELCEQLTGLENPISFNCQIYPKSLDEDVVSALKKAGCRYAFIGVESGSERIRQSVGKNISDEEYGEAFNLLKKHGIASRAYFMIGFPGETSSDLEKTLSFPGKIKPTDVDYCVTELLPGTGLSKKLESEGVLETDVWVKYMKGEVDYPLLVPYGYSAERLQKLCLEGYRRFYLNSVQLVKKIRSIRTTSDFHAAIAQSIYTLKASIGPHEKP